MSDVFLVPGLRTPFVRARGDVALGLHAITLLIANQMARDLRLLGDTAEISVAPHLCPLDISPLNFDHSGELIERASSATRRWIDSGGLDPRGPLAPHRLVHQRAILSAA